MSTFTGKLYSVQIDPAAAENIKAMGIENYTSLLDIPEPVDLVVVAVPRAASPKILEDCIQKGVAAAQFFTSGFAETDTEEGIRLQNMLTERAKETNFHLIGPNCMGLFIPKLGIRQNRLQYSGVNGSVGFISQSGTLANTFSLEGHVQGVDINKSVSFGNAVVLESSDYLEYFGHDEDIKIIGMYLEGVKEGRRFLTVLREVSARKPVVIWKGGQTEAGGRAIASHTGSIAMPELIWDAVMKQSRAIKVTCLEELIDTLKALIYLPPTLGNKLGIVGGSGGESVTIADAFIEAGLKVPLLTQESYDELATFFNLVGASCRNPIDPGANWKELRRIMEIIEQDANIDIIVFVWSAIRAFSPLVQGGYIDTVINTKKKTMKPMMAIQPSYSIPEYVQLAVELAQKLHENGIPTFDTPERGAQALKNALGYYQLKNDISTS